MISVAHYLAEELEYGQDLVLFVMYGLIDFGNM